MTGVEGTKGPERPDNPVERRFAAKHLRLAARLMFEDENLGGVALDLRDQEWVDVDSFDAGLVAAAKWLLYIADGLQDHE